MKILIDLFDYSGNNARPYKASGDWEVIQVDIKLGIDIFNWDYKTAIKELTGFTKGHKIGIIANPPCTHYALSGAKHFAKKDADGRTEASNLLVSKIKEIIDFVKDEYELLFWQVENPMSRIHKLNPWLGKVIHKFNPTDYAGYAEDSESERYNKKTWLWGEFNIPKQDGKMIPLQKDFPGFKNLGGGSERTKELRSITPTGFCLAFFEANQ